MDAAPAGGSLREGGLEQVLGGMVVSGEHVGDADQRAGAGRGELGELPPGTVVHVGRQPSSPVKTRAGPRIYAAPHKTPAMIDRKPREPALPRRRRRKNAHGASQSRAVVWATPGAPGLRLQ